MATTRDPLERKHHQQARKVGQQDERKACRAFVEAELRDFLLLQIRDGAWHPTHKLAEGIEARLPADHSITLSGGSKDTVSTSQRAQGKYLFLKDTIQLLKRRGLVKVRIRKDGEEVVKSTPRQDGRFQLDLEFRHLLPRSADELARLEASLLSEPKSLLLNFPLGKPEEAQAEVLERKLGLEGLLALGAVINKKQDGSERRKGEPQLGHGALERSGVVSGNGRG